MRGGVARVLHHRDFRWLWMGQAASVVGDGLVVVAIALYVVNATGSARDLGFVLGARFGALAVFVVLGGVWADRLPRHRVMVATDVVRFALHAVLAALILTGEVKFWQLVTIEALFGAAEAFFRPAQTGLVPQTVPESLVQEANALTRGTEHAGDLLGPALATALVLGVGAGWAFALDALTFAVSAACLLRVRPRARGAPAKVEPFVAALRAGFAEVRSRSWVSVTIAVFSVALLVGYAPFYVLGPVIARQHYGSTAVFGALVAAFGAGLVLGSLVGLRWRPARPLRTGFLALAPWPAMLALFALGAPLAALLAAGVANGVGFALFIVWWETALAQRIPPHALSRVSSFDWMGSLAFLPVGYLVAPSIAAALGAPTVLAGGAALTAVALAVGLAPHETRRLRRFEAPAPPPPRVVA